MDAAEIGCVDWPKRFVVGRPNFTRIDEFGDFVQELALLLHVPGPKHGAGEHEGPVERGALALEQTDFDRQRPSRELWGLFRSCPSELAPLCRPD